VELAVVIGCERAAEQADESVRFPGDAAGRRTPSHLGQTAGQGAGDEHASLLAEQTRQPLSRACSPMLAHLFTHRLLRIGPEIRISSRNENPLGRIWQRHPKRSET